MPPGRRASGRTGAGAQEFQLGDEGGRHRPDQGAVPESEAEHIADSESVVAHVDDEVVAAHPEDGDPGRRHQAVGVDVLPTEREDRLADAAGSSDDREVSVGRLRMHTTNLVSGFMFIVLGAVFIAYEGTSALSGLYDAYGAVDIGFAAERWASSLARSIPDALVLAILLVAALALALVAYRRRKKSQSKETSLKA